MGRSSSRSCRRRGVPRVDDRRVIDGILWRFRTGSPWRDLPERSGPRTMLFNPFVRWRAKGISARILQPCRKLRPRHRHDRRLMRARPSARRRLAKGGGDERCMGRSRGGLTTKIHAFVDAEGRPIRVALTPDRPAMHRRPLPDRQSERQAPSSSPTGHRAPTRSARTRADAAHGPNPATRDLQGHRRGPIAGLTTRRHHPRGDPHLDRREPCPPPSSWIGGSSWGRVVPLKPKPLERCATSRAARASWVSSDPDKLL
ncbi:IS5 family transposase [Acuticoccus sp.]|uniref:IS5 family transposase n=1 Tax=Acuticoccus sp. TaxID=1904378 RepID=UPI003B51A644